MKFRTVAHGRITVMLIAVHIFFGKFTFAGLTILKKYSLKFTSLNLGVLENVLLQKFGILPFGSLKIFFRKNPAIFIFSSLESCS